MLHGSDVVWSAVMHADCSRCTKRALPSPAVARYTPRQTDVSNLPTRSCGNRSDFCSPLPSTHRAARYHRHRLHRLQRCWSHSRLRAASVVPDINFESALGAVRGPHLFRRRHTAPPAKITPLEAAPAPHGAGPLRPLHPWLNATSVGPPAQLKLASYLSPHYPLDRSWQATTSALPTPSLRPRNPLLASSRWRHSPTRVSQREPATYTSNMARSH